MYLPIHIHTADVTEITNKCDYPTMYVTRNKFNNVQQFEHKCQLYVTSVIFVTLRV